MSNSKILRVIFVGNLMFNYNKGTNEKYFICYDVFDKWCFIGAIYLSIS